MVPQGIHTLHSTLLYTPACHMNFNSLPLITSSKLASCLIYARALLEYVFFILWVRSVSKMLLSAKFA